VIKIRLIVLEIITFQLYYHKSDLYCKEQ